MSGHRSSALVMLLAVAASGCGAAPSDTPNPAGDGVQQTSTVAVLDLTTFASIDAATAIPAPTATPTSSGGAEAVLLAGVVPEHGIAYTTASGVSVAALDGTVLFAIPGVHIVDSSRDSLAMAAVVSFGKYGDPPTDEYAARDRYDRRCSWPTAGPDPSPYASGGRLPTRRGCIRDAVESVSMLLLCVPLRLRPAERRRDRRRRFWGDPRGGARARTVGWRAGSTRSRVPTGRSRRRGQVSAR